MTTVGEICNREVVVAMPETPIAEAAKLMRQHHVGTLVVVEEVDGSRRIPVGIVTDRDIVVEIVAPGLDPAVITVGDIATPELVTARENEGLLETIEIMRHRGVRRLPIVGVEGELVGIVSVDDILETLAEQLGDLARIVERERAREAASRK
jgi:CBS domain-containing protein